MRKSVSVVLVALFMPLAGGGAPALAADLDWRGGGSLKDEPVYVPRYRFSWTGFYLGVNAGYAWGDSSTFSEEGFGAADGFVVQPSGWQGGIQGGYNWQVENLVLGIEADLGLLGADAGESSGLAFVETDYGAFGDLTARLGWAEDRWLFSVKGGLAIANIETRAGVSGGDVTDNDETHAGWTLGAGVEYAFQPDWSLKIEYMYMDFGEDTSSNAAGDAFRHDNDLHSIKVGVNYRFQPMQEPLR
jgi:outer membrane immunogenic protein